VNASVQALIVECFPTGVGAPYTKALEILLYEGFLVYAIWERPNGALRAHVTRPDQTNLPDGWKEV
jgi:hypothetical protein